MSSLPIPTEYVYPAENVIDWPEWAKYQPFTLGNWDGEGTVSHRTEVRMAYDAEWLYIRYDCEDDRTVCQMKEDELDLWDEDVVELFVDAGNDQRDYLEFEWNPLGYKVDLLIVWPERGAYRAYREWDAKGMIYRVEWHDVLIGGEMVPGWSCDVKIPLHLFEDMAHMPVAGDAWRGNVYRIKRATQNGDQYQAWSAVPGKEAAFHQPKRFGWFRFM